MATSCPPSDTAGCLVLRVKRKREEDPAEALVVTKHAKREDSVSSRSVFRFVGTLKEESSDKVILDELKHYRQRTDYFKSNPFAKLSLEDTRAETREAVKRNSSTQRFKVTSKLRCLQSSVTDGSSPEGKSQSAETCAGGDGMGGVSTEDRVHICDAMQEMEDEEEEKQVTTGAITCNNSVMVREKVAQKTEGYVYDLYYTYDPGGTFKINTDTFDWNSLSLYESELVHDIIESEEEVLDDEDDSNDENNWRNDYPDEEDSPHSSDSERDNRREYRNWQDTYSSDECGMGDYQ